METLGIGQFKTVRRSGKGRDTPTRVESWLGPGEKPNVWKSRSSGGLPSSLAGRQDGPLLILQSWDTGTGDSSKLLELGTLSTLPSLSQFRRLGGWEGRAVRNCGLFLIRDYIW